MSLLDIYEDTMDIVENRIGEIKSGMRPRKLGKNVQLAQFY